MPRFSEPPIYTATFCVVTDGLHKKYDVVVAGREVRVRGHGGALDLPREVFDQIAAFIAPLKSVL